MVLRFVELVSAHIISFVEQYAPPSPKTAANITMNILIQGKFFRSNYVGAITLQYISFSHDMDGSLLLTRSNGLSSNFIMHSDAKLG